MTKELKHVRWGVERRLEFIEFRLLWEGGVNRADLIDTFGISVPQASKDLSLYQEQAPGNVVYDKSAKRYVASEDFKPLYLDSDPDAYFSRLRSLTEGSADAAESWLAEPPEADVTLTPKRDVDRHVLRMILAAIRNKQSVEIHYQSMNKARPDPSWRRITPHALGYDGLRWHVRAFSHDEGSYRDFLLPRALQVRAPGEPGGSAENDQLWRQHFKLEIAPHPALTPSQKKVVAKDYGMTGGKRVLSVRYAMLFYVLKRLNLLNDPGKEDPRQQHIVALNKDEVREALELADSAQQGSKGSARMAKIG
ncbi:YafY family protein [Bradyrhizobium sp. sGM-13]|uniref:helix-turn-helix transcriptional regulator n=1 Tax=Bradyrhizobium sp. sGM-13 TaxID=2831781 RepID=UPI001BCE6453|nr:WYL domain-containing protein [Bradyrhizobium sp. sGM-13]